MNKLLLIVLVLGSQQLWARNLSERFSGSFSRAFGTSQKGVVSDDAQAAPVPDQENYSSSMGSIAKLPEHLRTGASVEQARLAQEKKASQQRFEEPVEGRQEFEQISVPPKRTIEQKTERVFELEVEAPSRQRQMERLKPTEPVDVPRGYVAQFNEKMWRWDLVKQQAPVSALQVFSDGQKVGVRLNALLGMPGGVASRLFGKEGALVEQAAKSDGGTFGKMLSDIGNRSMETRNKVTTLVGEGQKKLVVSGLQIMLKEYGDRRKKMGGRRAAQRWLENHPNKLRGAEALLGGRNNPETRAMLEGVLVAGFNIKPSEAKRLLKTALPSKVGQKEEQKPVMRALPLAP